MPGVERSCRDVTVGDEVLVHALVLLLGERLASRAAQIRSDVEVLAVESRQAAAVVHGAVAVVGEETLVRTGGLAVLRDVVVAVAAVTAVHCQHGAVHTVGEQPVSCRRDGQLHSAQPAAVCAVRSAVFPVVIRPTATSHLCNKGEK